LSASGGGTAQFAQFAIDTPESIIPDAVFDAATNALLDTVGVGYAGRNDHTVEILETLSLATGGQPQAQVWGKNRATSTAEAAFLNATQAHALDYDDSSLTLRGHPSATLVSVALAVGEETNASGRDVLAAYSIGLEVASKLSPALGPDHYFRGWHTSATAGIFGATATAARLYRLSTEQLRNAWGIAASQASGLKTNFGTMTKALHIANAARGGIVAAQLARSGFTSDQSILDGPGGFIDTYRGNDSQPVEQQAGRVGAPWELVNPGLYVKQWPCCYASHRPIAGMLELVSNHSLSPDDIVRIDVGFLPGTEQPLIFREPINELQAKFSVEYPVAAVILDRKIDFDSFADERVCRPAAQDLMKKIHRFLMPDDGVYNGLTGHTDLKITTINSAFTHRVSETPGSPTRPLTASQRKTKFMSCTMRAIPRQSAESLYSRLIQCRALNSAREIWIAS